MVAAVSFTGQAEHEQRIDSHLTPAEVSATSERDRLFALVNVIRERDVLTAEHSRRVATYAQRLARALGHDRAQAHDFGLLGLIHDVGKVWITDGILKKTGPLTQDEYRAIQQHAPSGGSIVSGYDLPAWLAQGVRHHHEAHDGSGYPDGLAGDAIPYAARIIAVVDAFDVITSDRPYKQAVAFDIALDAIARDAGTKLDPLIARSFVEMAAHWPQPHFVVPPRLCIVASRTNADAAWVQIATGF